MIFFNVIFSLCAVISLCAIVYPFKPFRSRGRASLCFIVCALLNGVVAVTRGTQPPASVVNVPAQKTASSEKAPEGVGQAPGVTKNWSYSTSIDEMTGAETKMACTSSTNKLDFDFPYNGGSNGQVCFRRKGKSLDAYLSVSKGQFICGVEACKLHFRFDEGSIQNFDGSESTSMTTGLLFIKPESKLLSLMSKANRLKVQANYYQEGQQVLNFDVAGLDTRRL